MKRERIAFFPGTFDPPTLGHINIIERSAVLFDKLYVVVAHNIHKDCLFTPDERVEMMKESISHLDNVVVESYAGLSVDYAKKRGCSVMIRGVRSQQDFSYEFDIAMTNRMLYPNLEVLFLPTDKNYIVLRSSQIKEIVAFGANISKMVPSPVCKYLMKKYPLKEEEL